MSDAPELKPCPFADDDMPCEVRTSTNGIGNVAVACMTHTMYMDLAAWNRRASPGVRLSESQIAELRRLAKKATPGPWSVDDFAIASASGSIGEVYSAADFACLEPEDEPRADEEGKANAALIVALRNLLDQLIQEEKQP